MDGSWLFQKNYHNSFHLEDMEPSTGQSVEVQAKIHFLYLFVENIKDYQDKM